MGVGLAASQPVRRILYGRAPAVTIHLGRRLPDGSRGLPGDVGTGVPSDGPPFPCSALLLVGFTEPPGSPRTLVRSYRTVSPLPVRQPRGLAPSAVCFLLHFPASRLDWVLPSTLPCGVRTFLGRIKSVRGHPADSPPPTSTAERWPPCSSSAR